MVLEGLKIVSFCHWLQGPAAMQYLTDMGATVIKIEPPRGAFERHWSGANQTSVNGTSAFFLCAGRNAKSVSLDLKRPEAKEVVFRLLENSHALTENFKPRTLERLGLGYEAVRSRKPDIIYGSASGFGATGPYSTRPGQDLLIQAMSGLAASGIRDGIGPVPVGSPAVDQHGAALFALGLAGAWARWLRTGQGTRVESTLLGAGLDLQTEPLVTYYASGRGQGAFDRDPHLATWFHEAPYGIYQCKDAYVAISVNETAKMAEVLNSPALADLVGANRYEARDKIAAAIAHELKSWKWSDLSAAFEAHSIWFNHVDNFDDLLDNPQVQYNEGLVDVPIGDTSIKLVNHANRYDGQAATKFEFALLPGAHTREVLEENGFSSAEISELRRSGVIFGAE